MVRLVGLVLCLWASPGRAEDNAPATAPPAPILPSVPIEEEAPAAQPNAPMAVFDQVLTKHEIHHWDRHVRGFRREHNFALSTGVSSGTWHVRRFGDLENRDFDNTGAYSKFQYSYHLQIYQGFGYLLGSSVGYHYESADKRALFRPVSAYQFPGVLGGFVINFNPVVRFAVSAEAYLERHNGIQERAGKGEDIAVTLAAYDGGAFLDVFYDLNWALRLEGHRRHLDYQPPNTRTDEDPFPVHAHFSKDDRWLGLGFVYHLL